VAVTFAEVRAMALALPSATEELTWEVDTTWRVRGKIFVMGGTAETTTTVTLKASREDQAELVAERPETFAVAPYVGRFGWVQVTLSTVDGQELRELVTEAWRRTAPKRLVDAFDSGVAG
jgi:hypothetical protein